LEEGVATVTAGDREEQGSLLDRVLEQTKANPEEGANLLDAFLSERDPWQALGAWLRAVAAQGWTRRRVVSLLNRDIARIDQLLSRQINAILHHPALQRLEASWRGLRYLANQIGDAENIKIKVLSITWRELARDFDRALEFDQSNLFRLVYSEEFGTPGGEPYSVLLGDYEIYPRPSPEHPIDDVPVLTAIAGVAAAAFAPFITAAHPSVLGLGNYNELERPRNLSRVFEQPEYIKWRAFRQTEDARFIGLTLPHVLMRLPYRDDNSRVDGFRFHEEVGKPDRSEYLWGNAIYAFGGVLIGAFADCGWLASIRGVERGKVRGGLVTNLPTASFRTARPTVAPIPPTDIIISDLLDKELAELGFIPLCYCQDTRLAAFYSNQSIQNPATYDEQAATINARLTAMLQYMLCVSRFAHYIKVIGRDKVGGFIGPSDCQEFLSKWFMQYTLGNDNASPEMKAKYPLREAKVEVRERADKPGAYFCVIRLRPHYQLDQLVTGVKLVTELGPSRV